MLTVSIITSLRYKTFFPSSNIIEFTKKLTLRSGGCANLIVVVVVVGSLVCITRGKPLQKFLVFHLNINVLHASLIKIITQRNFESKDLLGLLSPWIISVVAPLTYEQKKIASSIPCYVDRAIIVVRFWYMFIDCVIIRNQ